MTPSDVVLISVDIFPWGLTAVNEFNLNIAIEDQKTPFKQHFTKRDIETHQSQTVTESNLQDSKSPLPCNLCNFINFKYNFSKSEIIESTQS